MLNSGISNIKVFACNSNKELAQAIVDKLGLKLGDAEVEKFSDGEISVKINETIRGADVFIIQSTSYPVNDNLMELLIMIDAMKRASAARITAVMPYYGYARQDRKARPRDPISAKLVANLLTSAGANRVLTMDLHCAQIQGFFDIPVDNLIGSPLLTQFYIDKYGEDLEKDFVAVSPDLGSVTRVRKFAEKLNIPIAIIDKRRPKPNVSEVMNIIGDIKGKKVILVDDMIDTAGTITNAANALKERGAIEVDACCTHGVLSGPALERIEKSAITELLILDTIEMPEEKLIDKITVVSVADVFADAINFVHKGESISSLFD
ncbi:MAG: ribose-phosphate diphosphokinase [Anaerotignum sp.]|nr:ribose-phosphate diphosphokinase [Anaerotignum sp.]MBQ3616450.1 ribose-phosphate diphosphokinase [Anaerotignum sp.]MBQ7085575.1 ribose-phosphate diphosphokinase [Anaerotignum sp.]MBR2062939.1 ribose-phosphate diphosphokinase [Anaerotignum sp.]MBR2383297.1 ribose-phosphate diphosphokinase [Anaerotignum sp.]